jgi:very-short-patch-repair endonuclease
MCLNSLGDSYRGPVATLGERFAQVPLMTHYRVPPSNRRNAKSMRRMMTEAELKFWNAVRAHRLMGMAFRRQMPIAGYIVDFASPAHRIIVEIDGAGHTHDETAHRDAIRDRVLENLGWTILRFTNADALTGLDDLCLHVITVAGLARPAPIQHEGAHP